MGNMRKSILRKFFSVASTATLALGGSTAFGDRTLLSPFLVSESNMHFAAAPAYGWMNVFHLELVNLSNVTQTGTVTLMPGGVGYTAQGETGRPGGSVSHFWVSGTACSIGSAPPVSATFSVAPSGHTAVTIGIDHRGASDGAPISFVGFFGPLIKVTINEDRGALAATIWSRAESFIPHCGLSAAGITSPDVANAQERRAYFLNGGRPF